MLKTIGISPKVKIPSIVLGTLGALVVIAGVLLNQTAVVSAGGALIAASGISFGVGYSAAPGQVGITQAIKPLEDVLAELEKLSSSSRPVQHLNVFPPPLTAQPLVSGTASTGSDAAPPAAATASDAAQPSA